MRAAARCGALVAAASLALGLLTLVLPSAGATGTTTVGVGGLDIAVHRGLRTKYRGRYADEDSVRSCLNAVNAGADTCEIDVRLAADGVPLLMHDDSTARTTRGRGCNLKIGQHAYRTLARCRLNHGDVIPRLTDLARAMRPYARHKSLIVELKGRVYTGSELARVNRYLRLYGFAGDRGNLVYESSIRSNVAGMKRLSPRTPALLISQYTPPAAHLLAPGDHLDGLIVPYASLQRVLAREPGYAREYTDRSLQLLTWKVNSPAAMRSVVAAGVTGLITDSKATLLAAVRLRKAG